jgi:peptidoglycan/LPS O-acetylase OafA/YrhL
MSRSDRVPELDGVRGLAIVLVLIGHLFNAYMPEAAGVGVSLFFVLSGYLITGILVAERRATGSIHLGNFYLRRARRLLPPLVIFLVAFAVVAAIADWPAGRIARATLPVLFYSANWSGAVGWGVTDFMAHTWSLSVEEQFYLGWPLIIPLVLAFRWPWTMALALAAAVIGTRYFVVQVLNVPADPIYTLLRYDEILLGCVLALARWRFTSVVGVLALLAIFFLSSQSGMRVGWNHAGYLFIAFLCFILVGAAHSLSNLFSWAPLRHMGRISYTTYLWHFPIWWATQNPWLTLVASLLIAELSWRLIELPILGGRLLPWLSPRDGSPKETSLVRSEVRE